jgi:hypothetical protein
MNGLPGYDGWKLSYPSHWDEEPCEHPCLECDGEGLDWDPETEAFMEDTPCVICKGTGKCDGECGPGEPPEWEPHDYE